MKNIVVGMALLVLAAIVQTQTGVTGTWQGETRNGTPIVLDLKASESALTGTLTRNGTPTAIADGKVSKHTFTFKVTLGEQTEGFTGEVAGDDLIVWMDRQGRDNAASLKRVRK